MAGREPGIWYESAISNLRTAAADHDAGFDPEFLRGEKLTLPEPTSDEIRNDLRPTRAGSTTRHCTHFSLAMSASRRLCRWVAWNISGTDHDSTTARHFQLDPEYDDGAQIGGGLYARNPLDQGHIAAFADVSWGVATEAELARRQSCYFSNITPQLEDFNRSSLKGVWGELEAAITRENDVTDKRLSVFGGPVLETGDVPYEDVLVPRDFWKVIAYVENGVLKAKAFHMTQRDLEHELETLVLGKYRTYQRRVDELERELELDFGPLAGADTAAAVRTLTKSPRPTVRRIESVDEINAGGW
jgi:endonuclease G